MKKMFVFFLVALLGYSSYGICGNFDAELYRELTANQGYSPEVAKQIIAQRNKRTVRVEQSFDYNVNRTSNVVVVQQTDPAYEAYKWSQVDRSNAISSREHAYTEMAWQDVRYRSAVMPARVFSEYVGAGVETAVSVYAVKELFDDDHRHRRKHHDFRGKSYCGGRRWTNPPGIGGYGW